MPITHILRQKLEDLFGIDLRSLALFRMGLALLIISDLINRGSDLKAHYTDWGLLPRSVLLEKFWKPWNFSIHLLNGLVELQFVLFLFAGALAIALFIGYRTRLTTVLSWILLISLHSRNPMVLQGGDVLFRLLLFWGMFLPLGATYSIDSALNLSPPNSSKRVLSVGTFAMLLQVGFVYWFTFLLKDHSIWKNGEAIYYAFSIDQFTAPLGYVLYEYPAVMKALTYATLGLEGFGPFLAFVPFWTGIFRLLAVLFFIGFHFGLLMTMELGLFPYIGMVAWFVFIPSWFWDKLFAWIKAPERIDATIYYDGNCAFCKKATLLLRSFFLFPETTLRAAQEVTSIHEAMERYNSWVVVNSKGHRFYKFEAWVYLCRISPILFVAYPLFAWKPIQRMGNHLYETVARHRQIASKLTAFLKYRTINISLPWQFQLFALVCLLYVFSWNVRSTDFSKYQTVFPRSYNWFAQLLRLDQRWNMFSPYPRKDDGWYVIPGILKDGREIDTFRNGATVTWEKPEYVSSTYKNQRWRKYMMNLWAKKNKGHRLYYGRYLCRLWNSQHSGNQKLITFKIYFMREDTLPNYQTSSPQRVLLWTHRCSK